MSGITLVEDRVEVKEPEMVDLDCDPVVPINWQVAKNGDGSLRHIKGGQFRFDPTRLGLYFSKKQQTGRKVISGAELLGELGNQTACNANLLDYFKKNPDCIPGDYEGKVVAFLGTIYLDSFGHEVYRCLGFDQGSCHETFGWLNYDCCEKNGPAAVFTEPCLVPFS